MKDSEKGALALDMRLWKVPVLQDIVHITVFMRRLLVVARRY